MHIFQNGSLVIHDVAPEDSGRYTCIAGNSCNIKHTEAPLYVVGMGPAGLSCTEVGGPTSSSSLFSSALYTKGTETVFCNGGRDSGSPPRGQHTGSLRFLALTWDVVDTFHSWGV